MDHKKSTGKMVTAIKGSPAVHDRHVTVLFVGGATWQQKQAHTSFVGFTKFRFRRLRKHFCGTKRLR
jgi:hypothetical protein